jgi:class 3 adenylate cyclase/tetratricopeptide (TPR) repeat protein
MIVCAACGTENDPGRKFCRECGTSLPRICAACGTPNPPADKFCGECGTALGDAAAPVVEEPATAATTERRLVSVLFLDLVSFTTLSEQRDAEDMRALLSSYFETARTVIERHGGVVEKFIGDAVMAVWGTPVTHEDDAERAVRTALELVDAVAALGAANSTPLQARAGVLTGEAATMPGGEREGMVTGDMVNTASRLQSAAEPGTVFVGEATYLAASRAVAFEKVGELTLKGKEEPVRAWRALRVVAERQGLNRIAIEPPFVGRNDELRLLKELLHATDREGKARVVSVMGIGGIGKSRLAWELLKYIDGLTDNVWWHHGRCPAYGEGVSFWALGEMVRMRAGIAETDAPGGSRTKLASSVAEHVPDEEERRWLEPRLAFLLGLEERPQGGREELFAAWRTFFERVGGTGPVVMVFEDLQWADPGLLDFIESMLEWSKSRPMFIVTLARPELADKRPTWGAGQRNFVGLHLEPLDDEAMAELVRGTLLGANEEAVAKIVARAEGVPLYAVETIRMLAARGVLVAGEHAFEVVGDLGDLHVPETLHALVASRLDALAPEDRSLLQDAAVLGKTFTLEAVGAITGSDPSDLESRLAELVRKEFLVRDVDPRSPERGQYGFVQAIIREVAYGMLSKVDRRARHLAAAHHLEALGDEELAGVVATHYVEALQASPAGPDADALAARARDSLALAADRAMSLGSPVQALSFVEQALRVTPDGAERAALLITAMRAARNAIKREEAEAYGREASKVFLTIGETADAVSALGMVGALVGDRGRREEVAALAKEARELLGTIQDDRALAWIAYMESYVSFWNRDWESSIVELDRALGGFDRAGDADEFGRAIAAKAYVLTVLDRRREAEMLYQGILAVATREGDVQAQAQALSNLSLAADPRRSVELALEAADLAKRAGSGEQEMTSLANAIEAAAESGLWETADRLIEDLNARTDLRPDLVDTVTMGDVLVAAYRGEKDRVASLLASLTAETTDGEHPTIRAWYHRVRSAVSLCAGDLDSSYEFASRVLEADPRGPNTPIAVFTGGHAALWLRDAAKARRLLEVPPRGDGRWVLATRRGLEAGADALEGKHREAASAFESVLASHLAGGEPFAHAFTVLDTVAVLPPELVPAGAVETARAYLEGIGAGALLERLAKSDVAAATSD